MLPTWADTGLDAIGADPDASMDDAAILIEADSGSDAESDAAVIDAGSDAGMDGGMDAGSSDAGRDAGPSDANVPVDANNDVGCIPLPTVATTIMGTLPTGLTFNRPTSCGSFSSVGTAVPYRTHTFCNAGAARMVRVELNNVSGVLDPVLVLYRGVGAPTSLMCLQVDDDGGPTGSNSLMTASINAGDTVTFVATAFDNSDSGTYALVITPL